MTVRDVRKEEFGAEWIASLLAIPYSLGALGTAIFLFLLYLVVAELSYVVVIPPSTTAPFWLPSGISFSAFLRARWFQRIWIFWLVALFFGELFVASVHRVPIVTSLLWSCANIIFPLTVAFLARRFVRSPFDLAGIRDVLTFVTLVTVSVIPSAIVAGSGSILGMHSASFLSSVLSWAAGNAVGIVLLAPAILTWTARTTRPPGRFVESVVLFVGLITASLATLLYPRQTVYGPVAVFVFSSFVAWAAIRFGARGTALALLIMDVIQIGATRLGLGPFATPELSEANRILYLLIPVTNVGLVMLLLAATIEEQRTARMTAEAALKTRDEFLSIAAHELRTPLTPLAMQIQMINRFASQGRLAGVSAQKLAKLGNISERQLLKFSELINDLLDVSRISTGRLILNLEDVDLPQMVQGVSKRFRAESESTHSPIELHGDCQIIGHWDRIRIEQIVAKLLSNALKYGAGQPIEITTEQQGDRARLTVRDRGIGISRENQARIFGRFERAVSMTRFGGLGLGLFIVGQVVEAHGGSIRVDSKVGQGSCFSVELPLRCA